MLNIVTNTSILLQNIFVETQTSQFQIPLFLFDEASRQSDRDVSGICHDLQKGLNKFRSQVEPSLLSNVHTDVVYSTD